MSSSHLLFIPLIKSVSFLVMLKEVGEFTLLTPRLHSDKSGDAAEAQPFPFIFKEAGLSG